MKPKRFNYIKLCLGYPSDFDRNRIIWRRWNGFEIEDLDTEVYGVSKVYAIDVSEKVYKDQSLIPASVMVIDGKVYCKSVLTLNLKRKWWELIRDGKKTKEFREIKPYWTKRLYEK